MSEKEPPKAPVAPEGRFQTGVDSYFKRAAPLTAKQQKQQQLAAAAKHKQLVEQQRADAKKHAEELEKNKRKPPVAPARTSSACTPLPAGPS